jgi:hypothetical protein
VSNLYLIFIGIALTLFAAIVAYSALAQRNANKTKRNQGADPLLDKAAGQYKGTKTEQSAATRAYKKSSQVAPSLRDDSDNQSETDSTLGGAAGSKPPKAELEPIGLPKVDAASAIVTELVARIKNPEPIEQQQLLTLFREYDYKFHRNVHIYGLNQLTDLWRDIEFELPSARFVELGVAIQLADRNGAMAKKELHDFQQMALEFTNRFNAPFEFSMDIDEALAQAQILDKIAQRHSSMAVLNVVPRTKTGFRMADIESCARDLMMSTDKNGIFVKTQGQKRNLLVLYWLACTDGDGHFGVDSGSLTPVHDLVVYMNVPASSEPEQLFELMAKDARDLATWLDGKVVDRNGKVMTQRSFTTMLREISEIAENMHGDGLTAGDAVSRKLF